MTTTAVMCAAKAAKTVLNAAPRTAAASCDSLLARKRQQQQQHLGLLHAGASSCSSVLHTCTCHSRSNGSLLNLLPRASLARYGAMCPANKHQTYSTSTHSKAYSLDPIHSIDPAALLASPQQARSERQVVAVAISGGVDSAVSALLLKLQGYEVFGVYMHNWDSADEAGAGKVICTSRTDLQDAKAVCESLRIPLYEADFVSKYWNSVFQQFLAGLEQGLTPNPDLACNRHIKFGALMDFATAKGADVVATGHYARLGWIGRVPPYTAPVSSSGRDICSNCSTSITAPGVLQPLQPLLLKGSDPLKDQTYFLASLHHRQLARAMFPVGHLTKTEVKRIAAAADLPGVLLRKHSSAGICFIGKRSFGQFLEDYIPANPGVYVDVDSGRTLGQCKNMLGVTVGQHAVGLGGQKERQYVVGKELASRVVYVAAKRDHPALYSSRALLLDPSWVAGSPPAALQHDGASMSATHPAAAGVSQGQCPQVQESYSARNSEICSSAISCQYKARYRQSAASCRIMLQSEPFVSSRYCADFHKAATPKGTMAGSGIISQPWRDQLLVAELEAAGRALTPGQTFVMYDGDVCLGSAVIACHGSTLFEA